MVTVAGDCDVRAREESNKAAEDPAFLQEAKVRFILWLYPVMNC